MESESLPEFDEGIKNMDDYSKGKVDATLEQATIWYERMGKFAELQGEIIIGHRSFSFDGSVWVEFYTNPLIKLTTPELINEFLQQENKEK